MMDKIEISIPVEAMIKIENYARAKKISVEQAAEFFLARWVESTRKTGGAA